MTFNWRVVVRYNFVFLSKQFVHLNEQIKGPLETT